MNRIAAYHPDSDHPDHDDFQVGDTFHDAAEAKSRLAAAKADFPGYKLRTEVLNDNGDGTSSWTEA